jgi:two-component system, OmpR family, phosphate regulon sensor histidine kinase PhoR
VKRKTLTYIIILATITVAGALSLQFLFLRHSYNFTERQFRESVTIALKEVSWQLLTASGNPASFDSIAPVEIISKSYYTVNVGVPVDYDLLKFHLKEELKKHQIYTEFEFAVNNPESGQLEQKTLVNSRGEEKASDYNFPAKEDTESYYFSIHFPDRSLYFQSGLTIWYLFTGLLLVIVIFFGYTLSVIIRQRQLSQTQKDFINNLTHELKTPISSIALSAKVITDEKILENPKSLFKYAQIIQDQNNRLSKNVEKVLNLALLEKSRLHLNKEKIEVNEFLSTVIEYFKQSETGRKASISVESNHNPLFVIADKFHFTNLMLNILENSVKYSERAPVINIEICNEKNHRTIMFTDNGIGISKKYRKKYSTVFTGSPRVMYIM